MWITVICDISVYMSNILTRFILTELKEFAANWFFLVGKEIEKEVLVEIAAISLRLGHYRLNWSVNESI